MGGSGDASPRSCPATSTSRASATRSCSRPDEREVAARRVRGLGARHRRRAREPHRVRRARHDRGAPARGEPRTVRARRRRASSPTASCSTASTTTSRMPRTVRTIIKADQTVLSVAAASVVAKVTRDELMAGEAEHFPAYGFESNRGISRAAAQVRAGGLRAHLDPPALVDLHGLLPLGRPRALRARAPALRGADGRAAAGHARGARGGARRPRSAGAVRGRPEPRRSPARRRGGLAPRLRQAPRHRGDDAPARRPRRGACGWRERVDADVRGRRT